MLKYYAHTTIRTFNVPYNGKFWISANLCIFFRITPHCMKIKTAKISAFENFHLVQFSMSSPPRGNIGRVMALHW